MSRIKDYIIKEQMAGRNPFSKSDEELILHYADPLDEDKEFYAYSKHLPDIDEYALESMYESYIQEQLQKNKWIEIQGNYYHPSDVEYALECGALDKKYGNKLPYDYVTEENCKGLNQGEN